MSKQLKLYNYTISTDPHLLDESSHITPELNFMMEKLHKKANKGGKNNIQFIKKVIDQHPRIPQLKNFLSVAYMNSGMKEKSYEINDWLWKEHPNYLFGILNKANEYYHKGEHEKMPDLMGENMELGDLYPDRDVFHLSEVISFLETAINYFIADKNLEAARSRLEMIKEIDPHNPDIESFENALLIAALDTAINRDFGERNLHPQPEFKTYDKSVQTKQAPTFENPIINRLYEADFDIDQEVLTEILELPRESVVRDLQKVLYDSICRYEYFRDLSEEGIIDWANLCFPVHAVFLLGEMKASEALNDILETFRQGEGFLDFWFHSILIEVFWLPLYKLLPENQETFERFMLEPGLFTFAKSVVSQTFLQYYLHHPEKREEIVGWYKKVLNEYHKTEIANLIDAELSGFMICDVLDADFHELIPLINQLYDAGYVEEGVTGTKEEVLRDFGKKNAITSKKPVLSIYEQYDEILNTWYTGDGEIEEEPLEETSNWSGDSLMESAGDSSPVRKPPKIGRNEPCPCGSGKKYKKCCGKNV